MHVASVNVPRTIDLVRNWYDSPDAGLLAPDFECRALGYPTSHKTYTGPTGMLNEFFAEISAKHDEWTLTVGRMIDAGTDVTVIGHYTAKAIGRAKETLPFVHVWTAGNGALTQVVCCTDGR
jgi:ketosteroid isomerase-like protein